ncbi:hypothetical protein KSP40_PGU020890 [Platanthera guangdongensis]|uniref:UBX domain-containing protein n=1 Tax=Platanthera guangdongensis TaxID=2320717 RepID=A0ABR2LHG4_9ASPA
MERSTTSLTYKGSISEAIIEAQKQKKLFLVFISGDDEISTNLENSTWLDESVAEAVSRYCIFLHLIQEHVEASQFSTIYPQKSVPSISAVGYNGVMLWQHEGYINAESFVGSIEKTWAAMHFQDTAATLLSVALASKKTESSSSRSTYAFPVEQGESSNLHDPLPLADKYALNVEAGPSNDPETLVEQQGKDISEDDRPLQLDAANAAKVYMEDSENKENETTEILHSETENMPKFEDQSDENQPKSSAEPEGSIHLSIQRSSKINATYAPEGTSSAPKEIMERENTMKSTTIHLSIRMPSGSSLQEKFNLTDRLGSVKNYVDDNHDISLGSYDIAIPYPRKVFSEEEMNKTLSELGFSGRQALIVIQKGLLSSSGIQTATNSSSSNDNTIGYFGYIKRAVSYINPFSYFGGNSGSTSYEQAPDDDLWEQGSKPGAQSSLLRGEAETSRNRYSSNQQGSHAGTSRPFGSNIHTLRHDEEDFRSSDRNTFWNGNSTQYGGNDK